MSAISVTQDSSAKLGFWLYLMTDVMLFSSLFATYMILRHSTNGTVSSKDIFDLNFVLVETGILLLSSITCGMGHLALRHKRLSHFWALLLATLLLGITFLTMELAEFSKLASEGHSWAASAFLTGFFTLVGTHGLHIFVGLLWGGALAWTIRQRGVTPALTRKFGLFSLFWHFLDIIWIFIFTIVYVFGVSL
jgi:cytochrome o ubiquinol oxidase subunit 3